MTLIRVLLIALVVWLILRMIKNAMHRASLKTPPRTETIADMVRCHHCGLHIPKHEAIESANQYYCSQEHRRLEESND